jgi:hypothetical protein
MKITLSYLQSQRPGEGPLLFPGERVLEIVAGPSPTVQIFAVRRCLGKTRRLLGRPRRFEIRPVGPSVLYTFNSQYT